MDFGHACLFNKKPGDMRRVGALGDHARQGQSEKRGGGFQANTLVESSAVTPPFEENLLDLHDALNDLAALDTRAAHVIELRYFGGLTEAEAAEVLEISVATLKRDCEVGRAWLVDRLGWGQRKTPIRPS